MAGAFESRIHVNGNMLRQFVGQNVSIMLCVEDEAGTNLTATSTDDQKITVSLSDSVGASKGDWIEVIGKPAGPTAIRAKEVRNEKKMFTNKIYNIYHVFVCCRQFFLVGKTLTLTRKATI